MKKKMWREETVMFLSVVKWFLLATCVGIIVGLSTFVFLKGLGYGIHAAGKFSRRQQLQTAA